MTGIIFIGRSDARLSPRDQELAKWRGTNCLPVSRISGHCFHK
jgi:hypothetical protein